MLKTKIKARPCILCGRQREHYSKGMCRSCYEKQLRQSNPEFAERQRQNCRDWSKLNAAKKRQGTAAWRAKQDPEYRRDQSMLRKYGLTKEAYNALLEK